jgi:hypothetical protein
LPFENPIRAGAAMKRTLVSCAEHPAVECAPAGNICSIDCYGMIDRRNHLQSEEGKVGAVSLQTNPPA